jgi:hypothetical protein
MAPPERDRRFNMMLSEDEDRMLRAIAEAEGLSASDIVRQLVRREFITRWPPKIKKR